MAPTFYLSNHWQDSSERTCHDLEKKTKSKVAPNALKSFSNHLKSRILFSEQLIILGLQEEVSNHFLGRETDAVHATLFVKD